MMALESFGSPFSRTPEDKGYQRTVGGRNMEFGKGGQAYCCAATADRADRAILHTLYGMAPKFDCLDFVEHFVMDLIMGVGSKALGCVAMFVADGSIHRFSARSASTAMGGLGRARQSRTPARTCINNCNAMVSRPGLPMQDLEFMQLRPNSTLPAGCLLTEGCRSEGGILRNYGGDPFTARYAPTAKDLALEIREVHGAGPNKEHVYLHFDHLPHEALAERLPGISETARIFAVKSLVRSSRLYQDGEVGEPQERLYAADLHEFSQNIADLGDAGHDEIGNEMASYYNEAVKSLEEWKSLVSFA